MKVGTLALYLLLLVMPLHSAQTLKINIGAEQRIDTVPPHKASGVKQAVPSASDEPAVIVANTRRLISLSEEYADTRYLGFAAGALSPWKNAEFVPAEIRLLRAILAQKKHQFGSALADLEPVLQNPKLAAEAWFVKAMVHQAMGDHANAVDSCFSLADFTAAAVVSACLASEFHSMGQSDMAWSFVPEQPLADVLTLDPGVRQWVLTVYAEVAGEHKPELATEYFQQAMAILPKNPHLVRVYAQHLLKLGDASKVVELLQTAALDAPLQWLQCQALQRTDGDKSFQNCFGELTPKALVIDEDNQYVYPDLIQQMGLLGDREML